MATNPWPGESINVILLPEGELGLALREIAQAWTKAGLLSQAVWVTPQGSKEESTSSRLRGEVFDRFQSGEVDVLDEIARYRQKIVRIVVLRFFANQNEDSSLQSHYFNLLDTQIRGGVPATTLVERINAIISISGVQNVISFVQLQIPWTYQVIIAPENRISPLGVDSGIGEPRLLERLAIANVASISGIWAGAPKGIFEMGEFRNSSTTDRIWVIRSFVRGVISEGLAKSQAAKSLKAALNPEDLMFRPETGIQLDGIMYLSEGQIPKLISQMIENSFAFENRELAFRPFRQNEGLNRRKIGVIRQVLDFLSFTKDKAMAIPGWIVNRVISLVNRKFNRVFQGEDGAAEVDANIDLNRRILDKLDREILEKALSIETMKEKALAEISKEKIVGEIHSSHLLWRKIRQYIFANLDGSENPEGIESLERDGLRPVVGSVSSLLFDPLDTWIPQKAFSEIISEKNHPLLKIEKIDFDNIGLVRKALALIQSERVKLESEVHRLLVPTEYLAEVNLEETKNEKVTNISEEQTSETTVNLVTQNESDDYGTLEDLAPRAIVVSNLNPFEGVEID